MSRAIPRRALSLPIAALLIVAVAIPAQAGPNWIKTVPRTGEAQGFAAAPGGGFYLGDNPTQTGALATISRYTSAGSKTWDTELGTGGAFIRGIASDPDGNAYVSIYRSIYDGTGYPYEVQQVKPNGSLGWKQTWVDADASLTGNPIAVRSGTVLVAERDTATGQTTIRRFKAVDGTSLASWTISGPKAPTDRPTQLIASAQGTYLLDQAGGLLRLKSDGTIQWRVSVPGLTNKGSMGVDTAGISVAYEFDFSQLRVRRFSHTGAKQWDKPVPGDGSSVGTVTSVAGQTYTIGMPWLSDTVQNQLVIAHLDAKGKVVGKATIGTKAADLAYFLLPSGTNLFIAGYIRKNQPLIARVAKP